MTSASRRVNIVCSQLDVGREVLRVAQERPKEGARRVRLCSLVLWKRLRRHGGVYGTTVLAPSRPVVHQRAEPVVSDPEREVNILYNTERERETYPHSCTIANAGRSE